MSEPIEWINALKPGDRVIVTIRMGTSKSLFGKAWIVETVSEAGRRSITTDDGHMFSKDTGEVMAPYCSMGLEEPTPANIDNFNAYNIMWEITHRVEKAIKDGDVAAFLDMGRRLEIEGANW